MCPWYASCPAFLRAWGPSGGSHFVPIGLACKGLMLTRRAVQMPENGCLWWQVIKGYQKFSATPKYMVYN